MMQVIVIYQVEIENNTIKMMQYRCRLLTEDTQINLLGILLVRDKSDPTSKHGQNLVQCCHFF